MAAHRLSPSLNRLLFTVKVSCLLTVTSQNTSSFIKLTAIRKLSVTDITAAKTIHDPTSQRPERSQKSMFTYSYECMQELRSLNAPAEKVFNSHADTFLRYKEFRAVFTTTKSCIFPVFTFHIKSREEYCIPFFCLHADTIALHNGF